MGTKLWRLSGKNYALNELRTRGIADLAIHDFDEIGVPVGADTAWRHGANEAWLRRGLDYQAEGVDLLLAGQNPARRNSSGAVSATI